MTSEVQICNRALQKLGAKSIVSLSQDSVNARACNGAYEAIRDALLTDHVWRFAIKRASLAADSTTPGWGKAYSYTLPPDYLTMAPRYPEDNPNDRDWEVEDGKIFTNDSAPLYLRYVSRVTDPTRYNRLFSEALSTVLAVELCEQITQSNTKKAALEADFKEILNRAKRTNAMESIPQVPTEDTFITSRF